MTLSVRPLGTSGLRVAGIGFGCMGLSSIYGAAEDQESVATIHQAIDLGVTLFDTAEIYGPYHNEELLGRAIAGRRQELVLATKFGWALQGGKVTGLDSRPATIRSAVEGSLRRLNTDYIDLYQQHRVDPATPIEDVAGVIGDLVAEGKILYFGLSEAGPDTIRRAHDVHPVATLQSEYSLWERGIEARVLPVLRELGIGLIPFAPLGRGFLTGHAPRPDERPDGDLRATDPRVAAENYDINIRLTQVIRDVAGARGSTSGQVALAWLLAKGDDIVPIPGTRRAAHLVQNVAAAALPLAPDEIETLEQGLRPGSTAGPRYMPNQLGLVE